jgi:hypothetical protein
MRPLIRLVKNAHFRIRNCQPSQWYNYTFKNEGKTRFSIQFYQSLFGVRLRFQVVMVESPTYFNSTHPVLIAMKEISIEEFKLYREV